MKSNERLVITFVAMKKTSVLKLLLLRIELKLFKNSIFRSETIDASVVVASFSFSASVQNEY